MVINTAALEAGQFFQDTDIIQGEVTNTDVFAKGNLLYHDPATSTWKVTPASAVRGDFGVALEAATSTTANKKIRIAVGGRATVIADGAIEFGDPVTNSATTAGQVVVFVAAASTTDIDKVVGWFSGYETGSDKDGLIPADAANDSVIIITLRGRGGKY